MVNHTAKAMIAAIGTNQRASCTLRVGEDVCSIAFIIWAYTMTRKKGSVWSMIDLQGAAQAQQSCG